MALAEYADESFGRVSAYVAEVRERALQRRVAAEQARRRAAEARKNAEEVIESTRRLRPMGDVGYDAVRADAARCPDLVARAPADVRSRGTGDAGVMACATHLEPRSEGGTTMGKVIECAKVDPSSGCTHVVRGATEEEVLKNAMEHATQHGIRDVTPELMAKVKGAIRDEK
jgi:predicted small metal-binding protein